MKNLIIIIIVILLPVAVSAVTGESFGVGNTTFYNFSDGVSGTKNTIGETTYYNFNNGITGTSNTIGNTTFYNFSDGTSGNLIGDSVQYKAPQSYNYAPSDSVYQNQLLLDICSGLPHSLYPNFSTTTNKYYEQCIDQSCNGDCGQTAFLNTITSCNAGSSTKAYEEIKEICISLKRSKFSANVTTAISSENIDEETSDLKKPTQAVDDIQNEVLDSKNEENDYDRIIDEEGGYLDYIEKIAAEKVSDNSEGSNTQVADKNIFQKILDFFEEIFSWIKELFS